MRAAWYVTGTIRVAVCNRIFTRSSWLVSGSKFATKGGRRKKRRTKLRGAGEGYLRLNEFTCLLIPLERWITSVDPACGGGGIVPVIGLGLGLGLGLFCLYLIRVGRFSVVSFDQCDS